MALADKIVAKYTAKGRVAKHVPYKGKTADKPSKAEQTLITSFLG